MTEMLEKIQNETLSILRQYIKRGESVALLDYPNHFNAGDLLIYRGETNYLRQLGATLDYVCPTHTYDRRVLEERVPSGPVLLHGGGNFGDRWPAYQGFREKVIADLPHRKIVQMPQTMDFQSETELARIQELYSAHPDLTLMIRDRVGYERATEWFPKNEVVYCPDSAFGLGTVDAIAAPKHDVVVLKRGDHESVHEDHAVFAPAYVTDWHVSLADNLKWWPVTLIGTVLHQVKPLRRRLYPTFRRAFEWQTDMVVDGAVEILSQGSLVVTDRLHAAVLAVLMGKPVVMVDNVNKKISTIYNELLSEFPDAHLANSFVDAERVARSLE